MMLSINRSGRAPLLAAHVTDFRGVHSPVMWRHAARRQLTGLPGLVFAKAMPFIGSRSSAGFGAGVPAARSQVLLTAWRTQSDFEAFLVHPIAERLAVQTGSWWALFEVASTRGSHYGATPLSATAAGSGAFAVLTLGSTRSQNLVRFLREGTRLGAYIREAPGLITAYSAGVPLTGNCTVSIWESEEDMIRFAYRNTDGHGNTVRRDQPILAEQLSARMRLRRLGGGWDPSTPHADRLSRLAATLRDGWIGVTGA
jgi:heme-degrading monooxygenase HmoA